MLVKEFGGDYNCSMDY
uniref:Uncharacterized protein n=1 Tax=Arundo donax TaxID=35708 RepID=A0A0A8ZY67_ARUDO